MRYENAELEIVKFLAEDIIATSTVQGGGMGGENEGELDPI
jgi:hypothetical protein